MLVRPYVRFWTNWKTEALLAPKASATTQRLQLTLFEAEPAPVMKELYRLDLNNLTPIEALKVLDDWKRKFSGGA